MSCSETSNKKRERKKNKKKKEQQKISNVKKSACVCYALSVQFFLCRLLQKKIVFFLGGYYLCCCTWGWVEGFFLSKQKKSKAKQQTNKQNKQKPTKCVIQRALSLLFPLPSPIFFLRDFPRFLVLWYLHEESQISAIAVVPCPSFWEWLAIARHRTISPHR